MNRNTKTNEQSAEDIQDLKFLVVDDDFINRLLLQRILESYGTVHMAANGKEAVQSVITAIQAGQTYDLVCLDIMMPEMNGEEALMQIRKEERKAGIPIGKGMKVFMITAVDDSKRIMTSFRNNCDGYIIKPVSKSKLIEQLEKNSLI